MAGQPELNLNVLAHRARTVMGEDGSVAVKIGSDADVNAEGVLERVTITKEPNLLAWRGGTSNLVLHVRLDDVATLEHRADLEREVKELRVQKMALARAMREAVGMVPPVAANRLRDVYRRCVGLPSTDEGQSP